MKYVETTVVAIIAAALLGAVCFGTVLPIRGSEDISKLFADSDVVCRGTVEGFKITNEEATTHDMIRRSVLITLLTQRIYKGPAESTIAFTYVVEEPAALTSAVALHFPKGAHRLLFLKRGATQFVYTDPYFGEFSPSRIISGLQASGMELLEADLEAGLRDPDHERLAENLVLLMGYPQLHSTSQVAALLTRQSDLGITVLVHSILLKNHDLSHAIELQDLANQLPDNVPPNFDVAPLLALISHIRDRSQLATLIGLSRTRNVFFRRDALDALRTLHDDASIPALVERLDDNDAVVRLTAIKALAEITGQEDPAHSPSVPEFEQSQARYVGVWKEWWRQVGRSRYEISKPN